MENPFDALASRLAAIEHGIGELRTLLAAPKPEWEALPTAVMRRRKAPETLIRAAQSGELRFRREPRPGGRDAWLFLLADLDRLFPARQ